MDQRVVKEKPINYEGKTQSNDTCVRVYVQLGHVNMHHQNRTVPGHECVQNINIWIIIDPMEYVISGKRGATANFDESVDVVFSLGIDTEDAEQNIRTTVSLPNGTGKEVKIAVFAGGEQLSEAESAGADIVGGKELATKVASEEKLDVDIVISTPEMMAEVGQLGKILGPQGLMPNPKTGTVTPNVAKAVEDFKKGKVEIKNDKLGNVHLAIGKASFDTNQLLDNLNEVIELI